jgi:hypothetical protein
MRDRSVDIAQLLRPMRLRLTTEARDHIAAICGYIRASIGARDSDEILILDVFHAVQDREQE